MFQVYRTVFCLQKTTFILYRFTPIFSSEKNFQKSWVLASSLCMGIRKDIRLFRSLGVYQIRTGVTGFKVQGANHYTTN